MGKEYEMNDYSSFFNRFREINLDFDFGSNEWSFVQFAKLRKTIKDEELIKYSSMLYATNLLQQIVHCYFPSTEVKFNSAMRSVFPQIYGILSTAYSHVCPSVPSTVIIYCKETIDIDGNANWDRVIELRTWNEHLIEFQDAVIWAQSNLNELMSYLTSSKLSESDLKEMRLKLAEEHKRIDSEINGAIVTNRKRLINY
jgi:hypothetical protein